MTEADLSEPGSGRVSAWRGRTAAEGLPRWLQSAGRRRYLPLLAEMLEPDEIPAPFTGVLTAAAF